MTTINNSVSKSHSGFHHGGGETEAQCENEGFGSIYSSL